MSRSQDYRQERQREEYEDAGRGSYLVFAAAACVDKDGRLDERLWRRPGAKRPSVQALVQSRWIQVARTIFGEPAKIAQGTAAGGAEYHIGKDEIRLHIKDDDLEAEALASLAHEMGHVWQTRAGETLGQIWRKAAPRPPTGEMANYANKSRTEHQAEAIAAGLGICALIEQGVTTRATAQGVVGGTEAMTPGSMLMAGVILGHPGLEAMKSVNVEEMTERAVELGITPVTTTWPPIHANTNRWRRANLIASSSGEHIARLALATARVMDPIGRQAAEPLLGGRRKGDLAR